MPQTHRSTAARPTNRRIRPPVSPPLHATPVSTAPTQTQTVHSVIDLWLGEQLRQRRKARNLSLRQLASACGISLSLLSQVERGLRSISLRTLDALAAELELPIEALVRNAQHSIDSDEAQGMLVRAGRHTRIDLGDKGIHKENLTPPAASRRVEMYRAVIQPGGSTGHELFCTHPSEQVGYVVEGQLELFLDNQLLMLHAGDSFCYDGGTPRRWRNPGQHPTTVLWGIARTPPPPD